ncbi:Y4yA family PLP-dependent enzyme [Kitasatospora sp. RB6PN24]|uniref:Y4yA family PLP-dependent enzyme n=1 Tax=Kitasatospora humi TaxID=2893891 RepID=UPI001E3644ED|nr:Y4yA family PLP-dependent enzyme [Kitasatospora humi]MCC9310588.1 Y4yA family PLP-dependent enzyme [Kitasatospora humi]
MLQSTDLLHTLVDGLGSPLNLVLPEQIVASVERFRAVYRRHHLSGGIFFAHKANRSSALVRQLAATEAGIEVASLAELQHALGAGFTPDRITATGPKNPEFLWLAARAGAIVNVDSRAELLELVALVGRHGLPRVRVMLRLSAFEAPGVTVLSRPSRFGTPVAEVAGLLEAVERHGDAVELIGVSYHLDTIGLAEKAVALEACVKVMDECRRRGLRPRAIDIGGGFGVDYLADEGQWQRYTSELGNAVLGRRPALTWQGHGYGLRAEAGTLRGTLGLYPAHRPVAAADYLDELLSLPAPSLGRPLATLLLENLYDLHIEPGRALVDQCGVTLAKVLQVRHTSSGECLVRVEGNAGDIGLEARGVLMDPIVVPRTGGRPGPTEPVGVYLVGNLCLEADLITRRMVHLPGAPAPGDLLAFANTAGYAMDFDADHAQQQPIARKVAAYQANGTWRWRLDPQYWPNVPTGEAQ